MRTDYVRARDNVRLATDMHLPDGAGPFPVILERTPYGRDIASRSEVTAADPKPASRADLAGYFNRAGYAVVYQDTRGRHGSEGRFVKYLADAEDGFDTCAWLVGQDWCDGRICTMGLSYAAHTQAALGCLDPPRLGCTGARLGRVLRFLAGRHPSIGRVRAQAGDLGAQASAALAGSGGRSGDARGAGGGGHPRLVRADAVEAGTLAAAPPS